MAHAGGRPTDYRPEYNEQAAKLCKLGAIDRDLADFFGVSEVTINAWKKEHPKFLKSIKDSKEEANKKVERALFERATGYSHPEDKIMQNNGEPVIVPTVKHYPPDTAAAFIWLKNRDPERWRDTQHITHGGSIELKHVSLEELESHIAGDGTRE